MFDGAPGLVNGYFTLPTGAGLGFTPKAGILDLVVDQGGLRPPVRPA